jgi:hypothetical protein
MDLQSRIPLLGYNRERWERRKAEFRARLAKEHAAPKETVKTRQQIEAENVSYWTDGGRSYLRRKYALEAEQARERVVSIWPVKLPEPGGRISGWHTSGLEGAEKAMTEWIRVVPNMNLGAYEFLVARSQLSEPEWPMVPLRELLQIAFKGHVIDAPDHPVMQRLNGLI